MKIQHLLSAFVIIMLNVSLAGCETAGYAEEPIPSKPVAPQIDPQKITYETIVAEAIAAKKKAASVKGEWRDIGKTLDKAEKAAAKGDYNSAIKLATTAKEQGHLGYKQAIAQQHAGNPSYLKN